LDPLADGWTITGQRSWTYDDGLLHLERQQTRISLLTNGGYRNLAMSIQARTPDDLAVFGLLLRAQSDGRMIQIAVRRHRISIVLGERVEVAEFDWLPGEWHDLDVTARHQDLELSVDGTRVILVGGVGIGGPGAIGLYCQTGAVDLRDLRVRRFAD
jgi:hypothetical protein